MSLVKGEDWVFYMFDAGLWKPFVCARSGNISVDTDTIETTVTGSGNWKTFRPTVHGFSAEVDGIISLNVSGSMSLPELQYLQFTKAKILCRFTVTSLLGDIYTKEAYFYITNTTDTGSFDGIATFSMALQGTGAITQIYTNPDPIIQGTMYRYPTMGNTAPATTGAYTWSTGLINKNVINVVKDGRGSSDIILSGTPVGNEVLYDSATGDFTWAIPFEDVETPPYVEYQNL